MNLSFLLGIAPSLVWLLFYLRKDSRPEPKKMVLKIFIFSSFFVGLAFILEIAVREISLKLPLFLLSIVIFFIIPLIEEFTKFLPLKIFLFKSPYLDEGTDFIFYMIISALSFAGIENILILKMGEPLIKMTEIVSLLLGRFLTATFLHSLTSGIFGYFLYLSYLNLKRKNIIFLKGLFLVSLLHGFYNFLIISIEGSFIIKSGAMITLNWPTFLLSSSLLIFLLSFLGIFLLKKIKKLSLEKAICRL